MTDPVDQPPRPRRETALRRAQIAAWVALALALVSVGSMPTASVAGLALLAASVLLACRSIGTGARAAAALAFAFALVVLAATVSDNGTLAANWPTLTVLLFGSGPLVVGAFGPPGVRRVAIGLGGFTLTAVGCTAIFVRLVGAFDLLGPRTLGRIPAGLIAVALCLGVAFLLIAWSEEVVSQASPTWIPAAVGVAGVVASFFLWRALVVREETELLRRNVSIAARAAQAVRRELSAAEQVLRQFALREDGPGDSLALVALTRLRPDVPLASALAVLDSVGVPRVAIPNRSEAAAIEAAVPVRAIARPSGQPPIAVLPVPGDTARLVIHAATCVAGACRGGVAAVVTAERLVQRAANDLSGDWTITIGAPRGPVPASTRTVQVVPLGISNVDWILIARPTPATVGALRSTLPEVALILGLVLSGLLTVTVRLGDRALTSARTVERMRLSAALDRATDALWEWDVRAGTLARSPDLWRYMGFDPDRRLHTLAEWLELVHPDDRDRVTAALWQHVAHERETFEAEYRVATPAGDWHIVVDRGRAVERDITGHAVRVLGITADVTRARRTEQEFHEIETLTSMGRIAARVAHEINNPLAGIRSAFLLIKDAVPAHHPHHRYVGAIEREVDRIAAVTRSLYETYRPEHESDQTAVATVIGDAVALLAEMNRKAQVRIETDLAGIPSAVPVRGALLRQIVYNLVQNAIDASPVGGTVMLSGRMNGKGMILSVTDQGSGVPEVLHDRIFEPFFTTKGSNAENSGMGLGLSMVARSVKAAGGTIDVGRGDLGGAVFVVHLPIDQLES